MKVINFYCSLVMQTEKPFSSSCIYQQYWYGGSFVCTVWFNIQIVWFELQQCMKIKYQLFFHPYRFIVTGDVAGHVRFLDLQLRLSNW